MELFGLADCNNFYCSCERVFHPDLIGKPVVVLSNNDGCVIARSEESKALGIKMGDVFYQVKDKLEQNEVAVFSSNYNLYAMMKHNAIVWDFMTTVIGEKYRTQDFTLTKTDVSAFFFALREQNEDVATWSETTIQKIKQVLVKSLVECEYLDSTKSETLNPVYLYPELEEVIEGKDQAALCAFNCLR